LYGKKFKNKKSDAEEIKLDKTEFFKNAKFVSGLANSYYLSETKEPFFLSSFYYIFYFQVWKNLHLPTFRAELCTGIVLINILNH